MAKDKDSGKSSEALRTFTDAELKKEIQRRAEIEAERIARGQAEANKQISALVQIAYDSLKKAEEIAQEYKISFSFKPAYGMGGRFYGDPEEHEGLCSEGGWVSSSNNC